jgi:hypothetical protein
LHVARDERTREEALQRKGGIPGVAPGGFLDSFDLLLARLLVMLGSDQHLHPSEREGERGGRNREECEGGEEGKCVGLMLRPVFHVRRQWRMRPSALEPSCQHLTNGVLLSGSLSSVWREEIRSFGVARNSKGKAADQELW